MKDKYYPPYSGLTTDIVGDSSHAEITWDLIRMVEHNDSLKRLLEKAIEQGRKLNPDPMTNPVVSLEAYYKFIDRCYRCMPWEIEPYGDFDGLYDNINQSMGCLYFVCDQPLDELKDKGYFHNSLIYHEPFRSWFIKFLSVNGTYLNTEESWNEECYKNALANPDFHLDDGTYEDHTNWRTFNEFFARKLSDPSKRPVAFPEDDTVVVSPADAVPQGLWEIDSASKVVANDPTEIGGLSIKTGMLTKVSVLLGKSRYADSFRNGRLTHTFLDINDYHRYHFPVSGTVKEAFVIPQDDAPGGVITWLPDKGIYKEYFSGVFGWQSIETRAVIIVETPSGGHVGIVMVGMCQVSSVNFEDSVVPGAVVRKGDPMGYFLFGGSDIIMIFSEDLKFELTAEPDVHIDTGTEYGRTIK